MGMTMEAQDWDERYAASALVWSEGPNRFVEEVAQGLVPGRALDLACGEGRNAIWLARAGWLVTGIDFSKVAIEKAARLARQAGVEVDWRCEDVVTFAAPKASYEFVVLSYLHLPAEQMATVIAHGRRALVVGGTLFVVGHARVNLSEGCGGPQDPEVLYEPEDVVNWLGDLEIQRAEHVSRTVETDDGPRTAVDALVVGTCVRGDGAHSAPAVGRPTDN